jgi:hypothetical protein
MGANPIQAMGIVALILAFGLLAGAFAGGGIILGVLALLLFGAATYFFLRCKPLEHQ